MQYVFVVIGLLVAVVIAIVLQIFLSRRESPWPGLVLPAISLISSIVMIVRAVFYIIDMVGEVAVMMFSLLLTGNIPTLILLAIYFICRGSKNKKKELDKMNIQDLE